MDEGTKKVIVMVALVVAAIRWVPVAIDTVIEAVILLSNKCEEFRDEVVVDT